MTTLWKDVRYGARMLLKRPWFTAVAVAAIALGVGANTAIFSVVNAVLLRPLPYERPEQLVWMAEDSADVQNRWVSYPNFLDWRERSRSFEAMSIFRGWQMAMTGAGEPLSLNARMVSAEYFRIMRARPVLGRDFMTEEDRPGTGRVAILSYGFWQQRFGGDASVVGQSVTLDAVPYTVVGVMPEEFQHQGPPPLWVLEGQHADQSGWMERDVRVGGYAIARLRDGVTVEQARADMASVKEALTEEYPFTNAGHTVRVTPLLDSIVGESRLTIWLMFGAVLFVQLIACANVANLLLARATTRRREFAVRAAMGASRWRLMRQLIVESLMLAALGGAAGLLLAWWGVDLLRAAEPPGIPRVAGVSVDQKVLWFTCGLTLLTGVVFGVAPAWQSAKTNLSEVLKGSAPASGGTAGAGLRRALVVTEVALSLVLLVGAGLLIRSLVRLLDEKPGYNPENVLTMWLSLPRQRYAEAGTVGRFHLELLERVRALPGVESAAISNTLPGRGGWQNDIAIEGRAPVNPGEEINVDWSIVSENYLDVMQIPVVGGRRFTAQEAREGPPVVMVDESLARRFWPGETAVGKRIRYNGPVPHEIVGVVGNVKNFGSEEAGRIRIYTPLGRNDQLRGARLSIRMKSAEVAGLAAAVEREVRAIDKDLPLTDVETMSEIADREAAPRKFNATLLGLLAGIALTLAAVGIYGVMSYAVAQRTHEIGIRMALGAQRRDVLRLVLRQGMLTAGLGVAAGLAGALAATRLMSSMLYGVRAHDPLTFAAVAALLLAVALVACLVPARRATKVDPMVALRHE